MSDFQKVVVVCAVLCAGAIGFFIGTGINTADAPVLDPAVSEEGNILLPRDTTGVELDETTNNAPQGEAGTDEPFVPKTRNEIIVTSFDTCVAAGNPVMESYPRQCTAQGKTYTEIVGTDEDEVDEDEDPVGTTGTRCTEEQRMAEACTMQYDPVCAYVAVECVTTPCPPVPETYGNACEACLNDRVVSYTMGACENGT